MDYELVPIDDEVIREHQDTADIYLEAGVIHQPIKASLAFDRSLVTNLSATR
jgi:hypothetical protein